jgi:phosphoserine aminotransferase
VRVPDGDWIPDDRAGLTICDATSAVFAMEMPWDKLDVVTFSFQKALGGEGGHGVIILSPRAVERVNSYQPSRPVPKIFKLHKKDRLDTALFEGATINTPSMLVIEDAIDTLSWAEGLGGAKGLIARVDESFDHYRAWLERTPRFASLARDPATMSPTALCLVVTDAWFLAQQEALQKQLVKDMLTCLEEEGVAVDIGAYRDAPTGLRIWGGPTVDPADIERLLPWIDWAYETARAHHRQKAA